MTINQAFAESLASDLMWNKYMTRFIFQRRPIFIVVHALMILAILMASGRSVGAAVPEWRSGQVKAIHVDSYDIVLTFSQAGPCGSSFYHIVRSNPNFKEMYSAMLLAFGAGKNVSLYVTSCGNDRNILSHGSIF